VLISFSVIVEFSEGTTCLSGDNLLAPTGSEATSWDPTISDLDQDIFADSIDDKLDLGLF
jgi:hypothetical protein